MAVMYSTRYRRHLELWFDEPQPAKGFDVVTRCSTPVRGERGQSTDFYSLQIDLTKSPDEILAGFARNTRAQIRESIDGGTVEADDFRFDFIEDASVADLEEFVAFYDVFADSKHLSRLYMPRMLGYLESGAFSLTRVVRLNKTLVWHATVRTRTHVGVMLSASHFRLEGSPEMRKLIGCANRNLHWQEMLHYKRKGYEIYDFGGWYEGTADQQKLLINRFKEEFGGNKVHAFTVREEWSPRAKLLAALNRMRDRIDATTVPVRSLSVVKG